MRRDDGAVAPLVAICMVALLGFGALVFDVGQLFAERRQLQNGADAAVLSLALGCPADPACSVDLSTITLAETKADQNANDGAATITEICGETTLALSTLSSCTTPSGNTDWDCRPVPPAPLDVNYVQVRTKTRNSGGDLVPPILAGVLLGPGYDGSTVRACARASWGGAGGLTSAIPLTVSNCEFEALVGNPPTNFAPSPPYPPYPAAAIWEKTLYFHDTTEAAANDCPAGPSGGDDPLSGGFGWLDSTDCEATSTTTDWFASSPGTSPGNDCKASQLDDLIGVPAYIPIYDRTNGLNGAGGEYGMLGYAAFVLTGYNLGGGYKEESIVSGSPGVYPCANDPRTGSQRCISGFFTQVLTPTTGTIGGPSLGAPPVIQMSG